MLVRVLSLSKDGVDIILLLIRPEDLACMCQRQNYSILLIENEVSAKGIATGEDQYQ